MSEQSSKIVDVLSCVQALKPIESPLYRELDDIACGRLFADVFKNELRFNATANLWYHYDGIRWAPDIGGQIADGYAKILQRALLIYIGKLEGADGKTVSDFLKRVQLLSERRKRETMLRDAKSYYGVVAEDFDKDGSLLNCQNCVIDLTNLTRREHSPELMLASVANVIYDPEAESKLWNTFISDVMSGDAEKTRYLQELTGYALTGTPGREELYILYGATTRNGKSTFTETIRTMFGDYGANIVPETLAKNKSRDSRAPSGDIARLAGKRFVNCSEPPEGMIFDVALVKSMTGGEGITARHLHEREFEFVPVFKIFVNTNFLPRVLDDTLFTSGRAKVITFDRHFEDYEQDKHLKDKLKQAENLSAVLNWALEGLRRYRENNDEFDTPEAVKKATQDYREESDKLRQFMNECLIKDATSNITVKQAYLLYREWCSDNGQGADAKSRFMEKLRHKNLLSPTATIDGQTARNVIRGYRRNPEIEDFPEITEQDSNCPF